MISMRSAFLLALASSASLLPAAAFAQTETPPADETATSDDSDRTMPMPIAACQVGELATVWDVARRSSTGSQATAWTRDHSSRARDDIGDKPTPAGRGRTRRRAAVGELCCPAAPRP